MLTFIRGNDCGNAVLTALVLIMILTSLFAGFASRITTLKNFSRENKTQVMHAIEQENREIRERYDLY